MNSYMHDLICLKSPRIIGLVWPTRLFFLPWEEVLGDGFDLAVLNLSDRRRHDTHVSLPLRIKRWGMFLHE